MNRFGSSKSMGTPGGNGLALFDMVVTQPYAVYVVQGIASWYTEFVNVRKEAKRGETRSECRWRDRKLRERCQFRSKLEQQNVQDEAKK